MIRDRAEQLRELDLQITSTWHDRREGANITGHDPAMLSRCAERDLCQVTQADIIIVFADPPHCRYAGGGRHSELGAALMWNYLAELEYPRCSHRKVILLVGKPGQVFHHMSGIEVFPDWLTCKEQLRMVAQPGPEAEVTT